MGWFSWSKTQDEPSSPTRENRQKCWETRDAYFICLDRAGIVKPGEETNPTCGKEKKSYEGNCAKSWVHMYSIDIFIPYADSRQQLLDWLFQPTACHSRRSEGKACTNNNSEPSRAIWCLKKIASPDQNSVYLCRYRKCGINYSSAALIS